MICIRMRSLFTAGCALIPLVAIPASFAQSFSCEQVVLKSASGVIGIKHAYTFTGTCSENGALTTGQTAGRTIRILGEATWERATGESREVLKISGDVTAERVTSGICPLDPFLKDSPEGSSPCSGVKAALKTAKGRPWRSMTESKIFWFSKSLSIAAAQALSKLQQADNRPPLQKQGASKDTDGDKGTWGNVIRDRLPTTASTSETLKSRIPNVGAIGTDAIQNAASKIPSAESLERAATNSIPSVLPSTGVGNAPLRTEHKTGSGVPASTTVSGNVLAPRQSSLPGKPAQPGVDSSSPSGSGVQPSAAPVMLNLEAEDLAQNGKFLLAGGQVSAQSMSGYGAGWSGNGQLIWSGGSVGAVLDLLIDLPAAATYAIEFYPTRAPDYAQVKIQVDGKDAPVTVDAYSPRVMQPAPRQLGRYSLSQGEHKISFMIAGKNPMASNYLVGIDRIRLYPSGPYAGGSQ